MMLYFFCNRANGNSILCLLRSCVSQRFFVLTTVFDRWWGGVDAVVGVGGSTEVKSTADVVAFAFFLFSTSHVTDVEAVPADMSHRVF
jgi:hypothetical protein